MVNTLIWREEFDEKCYFFMKNCGFLAFASSQGLENISNVSKIILNVFRDLTYVRIDLEIVWFDLQAITFGAI